MHLQHENSKTPAQNGLYRLQQHKTSLVQSTLGQETRLT